MTCVDALHVAVHNKTTWREWSATCGLRSGDSIDGLRGHYGLRKRPCSPTPLDIPEQKLSSYDERLGTPQPAGTGNSCRPFSSS
jgi:hypothetical protein